MSAAEVKAFTGFIAIDGSTHNSKKAAVEHSRVVKVKAALKAAFGTHIVAHTAGIDAEIALDEFIFKHASEITAALNQDVLTRKPRAKKTKPVAAAAAPAV